jgi:hypothetical protein
MVLRSLQRFITQDDVPPDIAEFSKFPWFNQKFQGITLLQLGLTIKGLQ